MSTVAFSHDGKTLVSGAGRDLLIWNRPSLESLVEWTSKNRYVPELPEDMRVLYGRK